MARNLSSLVIDPNPDSRLDVARSIQGAGFDLAGEASYGTEASVMAAELRPNVVLISVEDPPARALANIESLQQMLEPDRTGVHRQAAPGNKNVLVALVIVVLLIGAIGAGVFLFKDRIFGTPESGEVQK